MKFKNMINSIPEKSMDESGNSLYPVEHRNKTYFVKSLNAFVTFNKNGTAYSDPISAEIFYQIDFSTMIDDIVNEKLSAISEKLKKYDQMISDTVSLVNTIKEQQASLGEKFLEVLNDPSRLSKEDIEAQVGNIITSKARKLVESVIQDHLESIERPTISMQQLISLSQQNEISLKGMMQMIKDAQDIGINLTFSQNKKNVLGEYQ
jgi:hypothetical protein